MTPSARAWSAASPSASCSSMAAGNKSALRTTYNSSAAAVASTSTSTDASSIDPSARANQPSSLVPRKYSSQKKRKKSQDRYWLYESDEHLVAKAEYVTANDPRGYIPVWEYKLTGRPEHVMLDRETGLVLWSSLARAIGVQKYDFGKVLDGHPAIESRVRKSRGGVVKIQGAWIPFEAALKLARRLAWSIRYDLVPLFGPDFSTLCLAPDDDGYGRYTLGDEDDTGDVVLAAPQDPTPRTSHRRSASPSSLPRQSAKRLRRGFFSRDKTRSASYSPSPLFHGLVSYGPAATPPLDTGTPFEQESSDCSEDEVYFPLPQIKRDDDDDEALLSPAAKFPQPAQRLIQLPVIERRASWSYTAPGGVRQFATYPYSTPHSPEVPIAAPAPAGYFHIPPSIAPALSQGLGPAYVCSPVQSPLVLPNARRAAPPLQPPPPVAAAAQRPLTHAALSPIQTTDAYAPKVPRLSELSSNWSTSPSLKTPVSAQRTKLH